VKYLNDYSVQKSNEMITRWRELAIHLIVKFNDMAIKPEKDGKFLRTPTGLGERVQRPGYSDYFKRELVKQTGDKYAIPNK
jgi:peptidase, family C69